MVIAVRSILKTEHPELRISNDIGDDTSASEMISPARICASMPYSGTDSGSWRAQDDASDDENTYDANGDIKEEDDGEGEGESEEESDE
jgi:hypothetical protein